MGVHVGSVGSNVQANALPANATQTVLYVTPTLILPFDGTPVQIGWFLNIVAGTGTTSFTFNIYRGPSASSPLVGVTNWALAVTAALSYIVGGNYVDQTSAVDSQYSLTIIQTGASAAGTLVDGALIAFAL